MEKPRVVTGKFALSFSLNVLSIFVHISGAIRPSTLIWVLLERSFSPVELNIDHDGNFGQKWWRQKWKKAKGSSRQVTAGTGVNGLNSLVFSSAKYCQVENLHVLGLRILLFFRTTRVNVRIPRFSACIPVAEPWCWEKTYPGTLKKSACLDSINADTASWWQQLTSLRWPIYFTKLRYVLVSKDC